MATENIEEVHTLESEIKTYCNELPHWMKYLAAKILSGKAITDTEINTAYSYLLEELTLIPATTKPDIEINYNGENSGNYKLDLLFSKLENVEGVNALAENQIIEFSSNLTILYGANGSGKSGYVRLLKNVFYSKAPEDILQNIHLENGHKSINAKFTFKSNNKDIPLSYSQKDNAEFRQFAVFDGKGQFKQLAERNEFEFRPAGLSFFSEYTNAIIQVEQKINTDIASKNSGNTADDLSILLDGDSEIKTIVQNLNAQTDIDFLKKYTPFSNEDKIQKEAIQKQYDELLLAFQGKEKEVKSLENIKILLIQNKQAIEKLNQYFTIDIIAKVKAEIINCSSIEEIAKAEGIENFKTDKIEEIGSEEWKNFIVAAKAFSQKQSPENEDYPKVGDNCIFCQQLLSEDAEKLIINYWQFIKSIAEENAKKAQESLEKVKQIFEKLNFDLFLQDNTLTVWMAEKYPNDLEVLQKKLSEQKLLAQNIISDIQNKTANERQGISISSAYHLTIEKTIEEFIKTIKGDEQARELEKLLETKKFLEHKEKFNTHFSKFIVYVENQQWITKSYKINWGALKRRITDWEKYLSKKYFSQRYIDIFNQECIKLKGNFGVDINHTGSAGTSFRQLTLKGRNPTDILSEGEQKIIAIADFLAEMQLSEINRGIIFDDPVTSLDNERKKQIAERLAYLAISKQVIIFTHDLIFFYHIKNYSKKFLNGIDNSFFHHSLERESPIYGKVLTNTTPANEGQYHDPIKAEEWLKKSKAACGSDKIDFSKAGLSALRSSYEALAIFTILGGVVQRFDPLIRMGRLKDMKYEKTLIESVIEKHGEISDLIEGHLQSDEFGIIPNPEILENQILDFKQIKEDLKKI